MEGSKGCSVTLQVECLGRLIPSSAVSIPTARMSAELPIDDNISDHSARLMVSCHKDISRCVEARNGGVLWKKVGLRE